MCRNIREKRGVYSGRTGPFFTCVPSAVLISTQTLARLDGGVWGKVRESQAVSVGVRVLAASGLCGGTVAAMQTAVCCRPCGSPGAQSAGRCHGPNYM